MFTHTDLRERLRRTPFIPVRVTTSAGETFDIRHRDFAYVTRRYLEIGEAVPEDPTVPDHMHLVSIMHITSVEDLPQASTAPASGSNGTA